MTAQTLFALTLLMLLPNAVRAQMRDPGKLLGQTPESGSLPLWSTPDGDARKSLGQHARNAERGVFVVGHPKVGTGTAWVISRKHRLLITNAHIADMRGEGDGAMFAIPSGTAQVYAVEKVWYHPGVRRYFQGGNLSVRSMNPKDGDVDGDCPDLAILKLSSEGPDLPVEFAIATPEELTTLFAQPAAIMGFPGTDTKGMPAVGEKAASTYHDGVISRITDFFGSPTAPPDELLSVQYTMSTWGGFSGSPVFLTSGRIGAVHNSARLVKKKHGNDVEIRSIANGIRADCVLEMLVHHGLEQQLPFAIDKSKLNVERWSKPDVRGDKAREAYAKAREQYEEAWQFVFAKKDYKRGLEICNEVLKLFPNYAEAYLLRGAALRNAWFFADNMPAKEALTLLEAARQDFVKYSQLRPSDLDGPIYVCQAMQSIATETGEESIFEETLAVATKLLESGNLDGDFQRGRAHQVRAHSYRKMGKLEESLRDWNEAVRLNPTSAEALLGRASYWKLTGRPDLERADRARSDQLYARRLVLGMKIIEVKDGGIAQRAGFRAGDIILKVGKTQVRSFDELSTALIAAAARPVDIEVKRGENGKFETLSVAPIDGKLGITVEPAQAK